jgi:hypothetical protein
MICMTALRAQGRLRSWLTTAKISRPAWLSCSMAWQAGR